MNSAIVLQLQASSAAGAGRAVARRCTLRPARAPPVILSIISGVFNIHRGAILQFLLKKTPEDTTTSLTEHRVPLTTSVQSPPLGIPSITNAEYDPIPLGAEPRPWFAGVCTVAV